MAEIDMLVGVDKKKLLAKIDVVRDAARLGVEIVRMYAGAIGSNPGKPYDEMSSIERATIFDKVFILYDQRDISPSKLHSMAMSRFRRIGKEQHKNFLKEWVELPEYIRMMDVLFIDAVSAYLSFALGEEKQEFDLNLIGCMDNDILKEKIGKIVFLFQEYKGPIWGLVEMIRVCGVDIEFKLKDSMAVVQNRAIQNCLHDENELNKLAEISDKYFESINAANMSSQEE